MYIWYYIEGRGGPVCVIGHSARSSSRRSTVEARASSASVRRAPHHSRVDHGAQDGTMLVFGPARVPGTRHAIDED